MTARMLRTLNVSRYAQIASFTDDDIEDVTTALNLPPDMIRRRNWIRDARQLHLEKYGEEA